MADRIADPDVHRYLDRTRDLLIEIAESVDLQPITDDSLRSLLADIDEWLIMYGTEDSDKMPKGMIRADEMNDNGNQANQKAETPDP